MKKLIFIPTYNEHENVTPMVEQLLALKLDCDIVFMDDASPDGTGALLDALAKTANGRIRVVHRAGKNGIGSAHQEGLAMAYREGYDVLVTMDCDFTHAPEDIPRLLAHCGAGTATGSYDLVVGSRFLAENSLPGWTAMRRGLTHLGHSATRSMLGVSADATGAFRAYNLRTIPQSIFALVDEPGYAFFFRSMFVMQENRVKIHEIPIVLSARTYGHSKMNLTEVGRSIRELGRLMTARAVNPAQFRIPRAIDLGNGEMQDPQGWDSYWEGKDKKSLLAYDIVATVYRNAFIKSILTSVVHREFAPGSKLLHAGCGSGQVDTDVQTHAKVTAVDISVPALQMYARENPTATTMRADILDLPFPDASFDGAYNLGVVEHFEGAQLEKLFSELARVTKPNGKVVLFWPHRRATSAAVLDAAHYVLNDVLHKNVRLHPAEPTRLHSKEQAERYLNDAGFDLHRYDFGARDLFVQAVVVGRRRAAHASS
jgi:dolichol-phosphate mannosyltransferase